MAVSRALVQLPSQGGELSVSLFPWQGSDEDSQAQDLAHSRCSDNVWLRLLSALILWVKNGLSTFPQLIRTETKKVEIAKDSLLSNSHLVMKAISSCSVLNLHVIGSCW